MRLGRKLSEGYAVDREAEVTAPVPVDGGDDAGTAVPVTAETAPAPPVASGRPPVG